MLNVSPFPIVTPPFQTVCFCPAFLLRHLFRYSVLLLGCSLSSISMNCTQKHAFYSLGFVIVWTNERRTPISPDSGGTSARVSGCPPVLTTDWLFAGRVQAHVHRKLQLLTQQGSAHCCLIAFPLSAINFADWVLPKVEARSVFFAASVFLFSEGQLHQIPKRPVHGSLFVCFFTLLLFSGKEIGFYPRTWETLQGQQNRR